MKTIKAEIKLTQTQWAQLSVYIEWAGQSEHYYGNKEQFQDRDKAIRAELKAKVFDMYNFGAI